MDENMDESKFTGGAFGNFFSWVLVALVSVLTLFFATPAMLCWRERYLARHTYVNGMRLTFDGKGMQLFGRFMLWTLLSVITLGIYYAFFMSVAVEKWKVNHTHFDGVKAGDGESEFDGGALGFFGVNFIANLVTIVTLSFGYYWAHCYLERWRCSHTKIDGCRLYFDGTGMQYFGKRIVWTLLTIVTFGIYAFWLTVKSEQWTVSHTHTNDPLPELDPTEAARIVAELEKAKPGMDMVIAGFVMAIISGFGTWMKTIIIANVAHGDGHSLVMDHVYISVLFAVMAVAGLIISVVALKKRYEPRNAAFVGLGLALSDIFLIMVLCIIALL